MDQKPRPSSSYSVFQAAQPAVTCQGLAGQTGPAVVSPSTSNYVLASSNLRPVTNYTLVATSQVPATHAHQYVVQSGARPTVPQYVTTGNVRHILSSGSQPSNVTYMLPSGAHIVRMNNVITTTNAGDHRPSAQYILTSSSQKSNPSVVSPLGSQQSSKTGIATVSDNSSALSGGVTRNLGVNTSTIPILQRAGINLPKISTYYSQVKGNDASNITFRPKLNEQKPGTSYILTSNDWPHTKNVPITNLQKVNTNFMQIPLIQKSGTVLSTNVIKPNIEIQHQRPQSQSIRSVILPSNYRTATVSQQQGTDCKLVLNSINVSSQQVLNSNDSKSSTPSTSVSNVQQLNTNYMQIPMAQKPGTILTRNNSQQSIGQPNQTIRSVIIPSNYRAAMVSPRKGLDYRLILKPVLRNTPPSRYNTPRNTSVRNPSIRQSLTPPVHSTSSYTRVPMPRPPISRIQNEVIANSKIKPISLRERKSQLVITERSVQICIDEINKTNHEDNQQKLILTDDAMKLVQAEVTYRLFYLLRECKKVLIRSRSITLTEDSVRQVCTEYFATFYGNKLWPLFCLKPNDDDDPNDENRVWMRKHNNVNLIGWLKHPKFRNPSFIKKRRGKKSKKTKLALQELMKVSEVLYECSTPTTSNDASKDSPQTTKRIILKSLKKDQVPFSSILPKTKNNDIDNNLIFKPTSHSLVDIPQTSKIPSTSKQITTTK